jgi:hypothetical protein
MRAKARRVFFAAARMRPCPGRMVRASSIARSYLQGFARATQVQLPFTPVEQEMFF